MARSTTFTELYATIGAIVTEATGRKWWRKGGIQAIPKEPYATIMLEGGDGYEYDVVENIETGNDFLQVPRGMSDISVKVEFFKGTAVVHAALFRAAMFLEKRNWDLWEIAGQAGNFKLVDVSTAFLSDTESRAEVRFGLLAHIVELTSETVTTIDSITVTLETDLLDGSTEETTTTVVNTEGGS
jgi:hypothetical protein